MVFSETEVGSAFFQLLGRLDDVMDSEPAIMLFEGPLLQSGDAGFC